MKQKTDKLRCGISGARFQTMEAESWSYIPLIYCTRTHDLRRAVAHLRSGITLSRDGSPFQNIIPE
eukprot:IDg13200t1